MSWLIAFAIQFSPYAMNDWACSTVYKLNPNKKFGCYDICGDLKDYGSHGDLKPYPGLNDKKQVTLANACAIVLHGAED